MGQRAVCSFFAPGQHNYKPGTAAAGQASGEEGREGREGGRELSRRGREGKAGREGRGGGGGRAGACRARVWAALGCTGQHWAALGRTIRDLMTVSVRVNEGCPRGGLAGWRGSGVGSGGSAAAAAAAWVGSGGQRHGGLLDRGSKIEKKKFMTFVRVELYAMMEIDTWSFVPPGA